MTDEPLQPLGEAPRLQRLDLDTAAAHVVGFCRQVAHDGILPSLAWFSETAETVDALRARSRDDLAAWREQDQALQDIFGACGVDAIISAPSDVARIVIELLAEGAARRGPQPADIAWVIEYGRSYWAGSGFSAEHLQAVRFSRQEDAERARVWLAKHYNDRAGSFVTVEHMWAPLVRSSAPPQPKVVDLPAILQRTLDGLVEKKDEKNVSRVEPGATIHSTGSTAQSATGEK